MSNEFQIKSSCDYVKVNVSNSKNDSIAFEVKFAKSLTISDLKHKLEVLTGGNAFTMQLELYNGDRLVSKLDDNNSLLGSFPIEPGMRIHVIDLFALIDEESVEKFDLSDQQYESKSDTVRNFLKKNRLGKYNEEEMAQREEKRRLLAEQEQQKAELCVIGSRCQITVKGNPTRRGTIMYNGPLEGKKGIFIGIKYDEPMGKNNGTFEGKSYFVCEPNYGGFVSPLSVEVGDFPPEDMELDDEI